MKTLTHSLALLPLLLAGCMTDPVELIPTPEESEYMAFVASQDDGEMAERSCVSFVISDIDVRGAIGEWTQAAAVLENHCSGMDIPVLAMEFIDTDGAFSLASDIPSIIPAGESIEILVDFQAQADFIHLAELRLLLEDPNGPVQIAEFYGLVPNDDNRSGDPPVASTGGGVASAQTGVATTLDATGSSDPEGDALTYRWSIKSLPGGSALTDGDITNSLTATAGFTPDVDGDYRFRLVVSDGTSSDKTFITYGVRATSNTRPTANAGISLFIGTGTLASLNGSGSSDPDGDPITYAWTMHIPAAGSSLTTASLSGASTAAASFTTDIDGYYLMKLKVSDGLFTSKDFTSVFSTTNTAPVSNAGPNQTVSLSSLVSLSGSASSDADGDSLFYTWSFKTKPTGSTLTNSSISNRLLSSASFTPDVAGSYRVRLTVDDRRDSDVDFVDITVTK